MKDSTHMLFVLGATSEHALPVAASSFKTSGAALYYSA